MIRYPYRNWFRFDDEIKVTNISNELKSATATAVDQASFIAESTEFGGDMKSAFI